ncbi:MAG: AI-2E family transporter [Acetobacteraceae bacterium]
MGGWPIGVTGLVLALLAYTLRYTLIPFVFAAVIGFVLDPVLYWAARRMGGRRWPMAALLTLMMLAGAGVGSWWIATTAFHDLAQVADRMPQMIRNAAVTIAGPNGIELFGTTYKPPQISAAVIAGASHLIDAARLLLAIKIGVGAVAGAALMFVLIPYFLISGPRLAAGAIWLIPPERRQSVEDMLPTLVPMLRRYVLGIVCVVIYTGSVAYIGLGLVFRAPAAPVLAFALGFLELIPVLGPITSLLLVGLTGVSMGGITAILMIVFALALRLSIDNLVGPLVLGRAVTVHPVVVIFAFVIGAVLFGVIGLLLAVPTAACIKLILTHYYAEPIAPEQPTGSTG